jgi:hypothetical protein
VNAPATRVVDDGVSVDAKGRLVRLFWRTPGGCTHIVSKHDAGRSVCGGVRVGGDRGGHVTSACSDGAWPCLRCYRRAGMGEQALSVRQRWLNWADGD